MAILESLGEAARTIGEKTAEAAKTLGEKAGDALETGKWNSKIKSERAAADEDLKEIGRYYYNLFITENVCSADIAELCQSVKDHYDEVANAQAEIKKIKAENAAKRAAKE